jgi:hypothetical protein
MGMKTTKYFDHVRRRPDRAMITDAWISEVVDNPIETLVQTDGRFKKWAFIKDAERYLRVILLEDGETIHNAFFDRGYTEKGK